VLVDGSVLKRSLKSVSFIREKGMDRKKKGRKNVDGHGDGPVTDVKMRWTWR